MSKNHAGVHGSGANEAAMHEADAHTVAAQKKLAPDAVPPADAGVHARSAAAHLETGDHPHTKPEGNLRQGSNPGARREPPMVVQRVGKQNRG